MREKENYVRVPHHRAFLTHECKICTGVYCDLELAYLWPTGRPHYGAGKSPPFLPPPSISFACFYRFFRPPPHENFETKNYPQNSLTIMRKIELAQTNAREELDKEIEERAEGIENLKEAEMAEEREARRGD